MCSLPRRLLKEAALRWEMIEMIEKNLDRKTHARILTAILTGACLTICESYYGMLLTYVDRDEVKFYLYHYLTVKNLKSHS